MDVICLNGEFLPLEEARVPATDAGLLLGDGLFETIRAEQGFPLHFSDHLARLARGLRFLEIPLNPDAEELRALCEQTLDANSLSNARLRITVTRGAVRNEPMLPTEGEPTVLITATKLDDRLAEERRRGWRLVLTPGRRNPFSPFAKIKSTSYGESLYARRYARRQGFEEGLLLNTHGRIAEAAMANVMIVRENEVLTPPADDGALPGIMAAVLRSCARAAGIDWKETHLTLEELVAADEVFLTNAIIQIMPVTGCGERQIADGEPGPLTERLFHIYREKVETELGTRRG